MTLAGYVEYATSRVLAGWAADEERPDLAVAVDIIAEGEIVGRVLADRERPDVGKATPFGPRHGFFFDVPNNLTGRHLTAQVAGVNLPGDLRHETSIAAPTVIGALEKVENGHLVGWALDQKYPDRIVHIELLIDGVPVAIDRADIFRPDLLVSKIGRARHGFQIVLPPFNDNSIEITVRESSQQVELEGSIQLLEFARESGIFGFLDSVNGGVAVGWAVNPAKPSEPVEVEFLVDGTVVGSTLADLPRPDVEAARLGGGHTGFRQGLDIDLMSGSEVMVSARLKGSCYPLAGLRKASLTKTIRRWLGRSGRVQGNLLDRVRRRANAVVGDRVLSILMPIHKVRVDWLQEAIDSVLAQWCTRWELICVDDASQNVDIDKLLSAYAKKDSRIKVIRLENNQGIARTTNVALKMAMGSHVAFMDHDDYLEPDAVLRLLEAAAEGAELIYSDEVLTTEHIQSIISVRSRPAFSYDYYLSHPYFVHLICVPLKVALGIGGWDEALLISADVDFVLRVLEQASTVTHVPRVLYRWRTHNQSAGHQQVAKVTSATVDAINRHLDARHVAARASEGLGFNQFKIDFDDPGGKVLIVIPTKNRSDLLKPCIESLMRTVKANDVRIVIVDHDSTDPDTVGYMLDIEDDDHVLMPYAGPFNFSAMNNAAVWKHVGSAKYVLFLNNDIEAIEPGWLERMRAFCARPDVGVMGATLTYGSGLVQHAGVIIGTNGTADHAHRLLPLHIDATGERTPGYNNSLVSTRDYSAVTAACMMMRTDVFRDVGGFDENLAVGFNDTDLCLRVAAQGYKVLCDPYVLLFHYESATRVKSDHLKHPKDNALFHKRWSALMNGRDPFYNPMLTLSGPDHTLADINSCGSAVFAPRTIRVSLLSAARAG